MLHLILGRAGSGKSTRLTEAIAADVANGKPAWLIIPEQQANLSERTMLPKLPDSAGLTFTITGFKRLSGEVAARCGGGTPMPIQKGLCSLLMWKTLRELGDRLVEYGSISLRSDASLTDKLIETVDELRASAVTPERLDEVLAALPTDSALHPKLSDLSLLYAAYDSALTDALDGKPIDEIAHLSEMLEEYDYFEGSNVYIDSFTDFTAAEYAVLHHILKQADNVTLTLCCDGSIPATDPALLGVTETLKRITRLASDAGVEVDRVVLNENKRAVSDELRLVERYLWDFSLKEDSVPVPTTTGAITRICASNAYAESEAVALHILDLVHRGTRYGDIAVFFRSSDTYRGILDAALERYGIPFYFSEKTTLSEMPLSRLLLSALRAVSHGFQAQDILTMLKTGLCPVDPSDADRFEQYVSIWRINGDDFVQPKWTRNPDGFSQKISARGQIILASANRVRESLMPPLLRLRAACVKGVKLPQLSAALYALMQELGLAGACATLAERELAAGYLKQAGETVRVFDTVCMTLTQISARLPDLALSTEEFAAVLRMVFDKTEIASVPSLHDSVTVGPADTLRVENVAVAFVMGLNEGEFPAAGHDAGLLSSDEKQQLRVMGLALDKDDEVQGANELFYVLRAMSKPSEQLFVSTARADSEGKLKSPSLPYVRLATILPHLKTCVRTFDLSMISAPSDVYDMTYASTGDEDDDENNGPRNEEDRYLPVEPSVHDIAPDVTERLLGKDLYLTQSKIERFVGCPYSFYCTHLLNLREREPARVDASDRGSFIHHLFEHFLRDCITEDGSFCLPEDSEVEGLCGRIVNDYIRSLGVVAMSDLRTLHVFARLRSLALILLRDILHELKHSAFRPVAFEEKIGEGARVPYYEIELTDGHRILLGGTVDRVDCYRRGEDVYLRVIDYKTGTKEFSLKDVARGVNMQLLIYLFSLCRPEHTHPAGAMYVATDHGDSKPETSRTGLLLSDLTILTAMNDEWNKKYLAGISKTQKDKISGKAQISADGLDQLERDICGTLGAIGEDMIHGRAARTPSKDACRFCSMRAGCPEADRSKGQF